MLKEQAAGRGVQGGLKHLEGGSGPPSPIEMLRWRSMRGSTAARMGAGNGVTSTLHYG